MTLSITTVTEPRAAKRTASTRGAHSRNFPVRTQVSRVGSPYCNLRDHARIHLNATPELHQINFSEPVNNTRELGEEAANEVIDLVNRKKDAIIVLPTGSTPIQMYKKLIEEYEKGELNFKDVTFFNLDEYIGLPKDHPLSYNFYMNKLFYGELERIDSDRAPKNKFIPFTEKLDDAKQAAREYGELYEETISGNGGKADLVILGIGGAYPDEDEGNKLKGGHIGFNEPGSIASDYNEDKAKVVELTKKTIGDTKYRFRNIKYLEKLGLIDGGFTTDVPEHAITLGIADILKSEKILLLANGEEKAPVIEKLYYSEEPTQDFPVSYLSYHDNVTCILDKDAASKTPLIQSPWEVDGEHFTWSPASARQAAIKALQDNDLNIDDLTIEHLRSVGVHQSFLEEFGKRLDALKNNVKTFLEDSIITDGKFKSMEGKKVVIFSPHPDDDVICCSATIKKLVDAGAKVSVVYITVGEINVRNDFAKKARSLSANPGEDELREARTNIREEEARQALNTLEITDNKNKIFLRSPLYYTRGFIHIDPVRNEDVNPIIELLNNNPTTKEPDYIFYSAENDSHGTHGLSKEVIKKAILRSSDWAVETKFWGYRGAYNEWPLHEDPRKLKIVPFDKATWDIKKASILDHKSQRDPIFKSFDPREFDERAHDRNKDTGTILQKANYTEQPFAEVYRETSYLGFLAA